MWNQTSHLWNPCSDTLPLSPRDSVGSKAHYKVHIQHTSCILLGSAISIVSYFVKKIRKMVSFKLGKEIEKGVFHLVTSVGQRENSESP